MDSLSIGEVNLGLKDNFCILEMFVLADTAFDFLSGSGSAFSLHVLVKMKAAHAHTGKGATLFTCTAGGRRLHIHSAPIHISLSGL